MGYRPLVAYCLTLADLHHFCVTKVYICIDKTVPGLMDVTRFLSLDVTICYGVQLNNLQYFTIMIVKYCKLRQKLPKPKKKVINGKKKAKKMISTLTYLINVHARLTILDFFSTLHALIVCLHI